MTAGALGLWESHHDRGIDLDRRAKAIQGRLYRAEIAPFVSSRKAEKLQLVQDQALLGSQELPPRARLVEHAARGMLYQNSANRDQVPDVASVWPGLFWQEPFSAISSPCIREINGRRLADSWGSIAR
jgi:hypothetical protein